MAAQDQKEIVDLVEVAAKARNDRPVPRRYIEEALRRIDAGEEVSRYPTGTPSLKGIYSIAVELENDAATKR